MQPYATAICLTSLLLSFKYELIQINTFFKYENLLGTQIHLLIFQSKTLIMDFPGGAMVKNPPVNVADTGSSPGPGRSPMPWSN